MALGSVALEIGDRIDVVTLWQQSDGAAEVVYNDECYFRVYDGASGQVHLALPSLSRTLVDFAMQGDGLAALAAAPAAMAQEQFFPSLVYS